MRNEMEQFRIVVEGLKDSIQNRDDRIIGQLMSQLRQQPIPQKQKDKQMAINVDWNTYAGETTTCLCCGWLFPEPSKSFGETWKSAAGNECWICRWCVCVDCAPEKSNIT